MGWGKTIFGVGLVLTIGYFTNNIIQERNREYVPVDVSGVCSSSEEGYYELSGVPGSVSTDLSDGGSKMVVILGCGDDIVSAHSSESAGLRKKYLYAEALIDYYIDRDDTTKVRLRGKLEKNGTFKFKLPRNLDDLIE
ncbi:hypothetical protein HN865_00655 [Candidatus Woesearchaeota archaeon]|jgi:hypothetical protein|nr:hypothetical protein [Candidatus Woesearchaeota archaeon]MBT7237349.1 hypothetical protein [Candidatus Woesearchaeota archaeon]